jgi:hypothetical protein
LANESDENIIEAEPHGYRLLQELVSGRTFLCCDVSENIVVLKKLDDDCLHRQQLHPSIKDRLSHVRELAHPRMATLRSVERWNGLACMVWIYLDGNTWEDAAANTNRNLPELCSALAATVDALHEIGIVHGSLHARNVIVRPDRQVWLTDVSPYLYTDPRADIAAFVKLMRVIAGRLPANASPRFLHLVDELEAGSRSLREFSHQVSKADQAPAEVDLPVTERDHGYRIRSLMTAAVVCAVGIAVWVELRGMATKAEPSAPTTFPSLYRNGVP